MCGSDEAPRCGGRLCWRCGGLLGRELDCHEKMASLFSTRICHARKFLYRWSNDSSKNELYIAEPPAEQKGVGRVDRKYCSCI